MAGPGNLLQRPSLDQELGLLKVRGLAQSLAPVILRILCLVENIE